MRFLFVRPEFCPSGDLSTPKIRLSSDSASRRTPLPLAKSSRYRATSGLSPYRTCAHRAHSNMESMFRPKNRSEYALPFYGLLYLDAFLLPHLMTENVRSPQKTSQICVIARPHCGRGNLKAKGMASRSEARRKRRAAIDRAAFARASRRKFRFCSQFGSSDVV